MIKILISKTVGTKPARVSEGFLREDRITEDGELLGEELTFDPLQAATWDSEKEANDFLKENELKDYFLRSHSFGELV